MSGMKTDWCLLLIEKETTYKAKHISLIRNIGRQNQPFNTKSAMHDILAFFLSSCFDNYFTYFVPVFKYCYSDSRNLWTVMRAGGLAP